MRLVIQRVLKASVCVEGQVVGEIGLGALVFFGVHKDDSPEKIDWLVQKLIHLRFFSDSAGKMNLSLLDTKGQVLIVSQFTLYADCREGRRPDFGLTAPSAIAKPMYDQFVAETKKHLAVETGVFGAAMEVSLINDGPVTLILDH
ncbi:MAG TPA: D-aminoacyl-tRNA deacylase [Rhabdochlamydiaceae bacterium]|nr:D-aminoacyl-tRNA deacylase [Rhabdochlamydiaceae bacterium]